MLGKFLTHLQKIEDQPQQKKFLLAISGGIDSMVMLDLFQRAGFCIGVVHCNFSLRGKESDDDSMFVENAAKKHQVPFFQKTFKTDLFASESGLSVQMAARTLRYTWFEEISVENGYDFVATAHHLDDQIETFFINLLRGTGIAGLHGILPVKEKLIRPMLFSLREEIEKYARDNHLRFREDSSNLSLKYTRNQVRHQLIPVLKKIQPGYARSITETINRLRDYEMIGQTAISGNKNSLLIRDGNQIRISIGQLKKLVPLKAYTFELLSPFGFNSSVIDKLLEIMESGSEKSFSSSTHHLIKDRKNLIITEIKKEGDPPDSEKEEFLVELEVGKIDQPIKLTFTTIEKTSKFAIPDSQQIACLDLSRIKFPLTLRKWKDGDAFLPLGMNKRKKLSDFFIDEKLTLTQKKSTWLLLTGNEIVWVIGQRIDNRFRITSRTKKILHVMLLP